MMAVVDKSDCNWSKGRDGSSNHGRIGETRDKYYCLWAFTFEIETVTFRIYDTSSPLDLSKRKQAGYRF